MIGIDVGSGAGQSIAQWGVAAPIGDDDARAPTGGQGGENEKLIYKVLKRGEKLNLDRSDLRVED